MKRTPSAKAPVLPDQCLKCHRETVWWSQVKFIKLLGLALYFKKEEFHLHYCTLWCYKSNRRFDSVRAHTVSKKVRPAPASYQIAIHAPTRFLVWIGDTRKTTSCTDCRLFLSSPSFPPVERAIKLFVERWLCGLGLCRSNLCLVLNL